MSIIISGLRLPFDCPEAQAIAAACVQCGLSPETVQADIYRVSIDARHGKISKIYTVCVDGVADEAAFVEQLHLQTVRHKPQAAAPQVYGTKKLAHRPVVIGTGPAGLFAAYTLARHGYAPIVCERGDAIDARDVAVDAFFGGGALDMQSNIQFGEGGAGAYSDGKLTTRTHDPRSESVLHTFVRHGAPQIILRQAKPHIGTDILKNVVRAMRGEIIKNGGEVHFRTALTGIETAGMQLAAVRLDGQSVPCERAVLAIGHSARDTFSVLQKSGVLLVPKAFSVGVRIEHLQSDIDKMLYGKLAGHPSLPPAEYTLSHRADGRACYSFCMCPGGQVVAAQSEPHSITTNGMSYHARDGRNANAALVVSVEPADFQSGGALGGIAFQRQIEQAAFQQTGGYAAPCQRVGDFLADKPSSRAGSVQPTYPIGVQFGSVAPCFPSFVTEKLREGLRVFDRKMQGFGSADALLTAPETRTSSPVRLTRGEDLSSITVAGLMPCGEGAGYAGGIMSAAVDGMRAAQQIMSEFAPFL